MRKHIVPSGQQPPHTQRWRQSGIIVGALLLALLTGCGVRENATLQPLNGGAPTATTTATTTATATPTAPKTGQLPGHLGGQSGAQACPAGPLQGGYTSPAGALVITAAESNRTVTARQGQTVVVKLPATQRWSFVGASSAAPTLLPAQPSGVLDTASNSCIWTFTAQQAGTATLNFTASAICRPGQMCADYILATNFTVSVA